MTGRGVSYERPPPPDRAVARNPLRQPLVPHRQPPHLERLRTVRTCPLPRVRPPRPTRLDRRPLRPQRPCTNVWRTHRTREGGQWRVSDRGRGYVFTDRMDVARAAVGDAETKATARPTKTVRCDSCGGQGLTATANAALTATVSGIGRCTASTSNSTQAATMTRTRSTGPSTAATNPGHITSSSWRWPASSITSTSRSGSWR
jgi:hypothetical protein